MQKAPVTFDTVVITDDDACRRAGRTVRKTVEQMLDGLSLSDAQRVAVLLRDKTSAPDDVRTRAERLAALCERAGVALLVHTYVEIANAVGAACVHLAGDADIAQAHAVLDDGRLLGASRHAGDALDEQSLDGLDYVFVGPAFAPTSKPDDKRATLGLDGLRALVDTCARPAFALGGITDENVRAVRKTGVHGVAVLGAVMSADDPSAALRKLL